MFADKRDTTRRFFIEVWRKHLAKTPLEPLESMILDVLLMHPEYQQMLQPDVVDKDFLPEMGETNPFLHLGLHIAIREQLSTDRPAGIRTVYQALRAKARDVHELEHKILECLAETLWLAQRNNTLPDEQAYLAQLKRLL
ncbi:DUF1841 family protein [Beggiatoa leptomitoformis]|uniref:DUF1841 family protein n=1 Tax=Beggiatoa leptomitoformis TaxID=288004 RepID=A0A2N9YEM7_9GAMM|nr:DUF1841 family protein [Beggiatoa leptomitoformis]ALG68700.1 DUF1841 family protein [Beggiatoa leptomitoformis]AUI68947.1 DUF1841 family protein [Beggiatoa leptomitoformis]